MTFEQTDAIAEATARVLSGQLPAEYGVIVIVVRPDGDRAGIHCFHDMDSGEDASNVIDAVAAMMRGTYAGPLGVGVGGRARPRAGCALIAALYVQRDGCYYGLDGVDPWDEERDARRYDGPYPVVAHPPCERWGAYATGGPRYRGSRVVGDDGGCFAAALAAVRRWGGVLEHPRGSKAWNRFGLPLPASGGGWTPTDLYGGASCCVEQGHYGHAARKPTWLYAVGVDFPALRWGSSQVPDPPDCPWSDVRTFQKPPRGLGQEWRDQRRAWLRWRKERGLRVYATPELMSKRQRAATPPEFRDLLLGIARSSGGAR